MNAIGLRSGSGQSEKSGRSVGKSVLRGTPDMPCYRLVTRSRTNRHGRAY
jgi:hypothetical protein